MNPLYRPSPATVAAFIRSLTPLDAELEEARCVATLGVTVTYAHVGKPHARDTAERRAQKERAAAWAAEHDRTFELRTPAISNWTAVEVANVIDAARADLPATWIDPAVRGIRKIHPRDRYQDGRAISWLNYGSNYTGRYGYYGGEPWALAFAIASGFHVVIGLDAPIPSAAVLAYAEEELWPRGFELTAGLNRFKVAKAQRQAAAGGAN